MVKSTKILGHGYRIDEPITFRRYSLHRKIRPSEFYLWTNTARMLKKKTKVEITKFYYFINENISDLSVSK